MNARETSIQSLVDCVERLDVVLRPWHFVFEHDGCHASHTGPYASGHYCRGTTRIGLSCRSALDNVLYEHKFITVHGSWREIEQFTISHAGLMNALGHAADCHLLTNDGIPQVVLARDRGDPVAALIRDLSLFLSPILREPNDEFHTIVRQGSRTYSIEYD